MNYFELPLFSFIYLEDSYVLGVKEGSNSLVFNIEAVLAEGNPLYQTPRNGEQYCYRMADLIFYEIYSLDWLERNFLELRDGSGDIDYGNIDTFTINNGIYSLSGDWGAVKIKCKGIDFKFSKK